MLQIVVYQTKVGVSVFLINCVQGEGTSLFLFWTLELDEYEWLASRSGRSDLKENFPATDRIRSPRGDKRNGLTNFGEEKNLQLPR
jgi:hypothetical protein